jgi:hypothetical protein
MSGLNAEKVERLITGLRRAVGDAKKARAFNIADELSDVVRAIEQLQSEKPDQPSRPDRIGDECWYESRICELIDGSSRWRSKWERGVLRCWSHGSESFIAMVEDCETHDIIATANLCFAAEDPNKPAKKPQD